MKKLFLSLAAMIAVAFANGGPISEPQPLALAEKFPIMCS
jgi:hypothetical protein